MIVGDPMSSLLPIPCHRRIATQKRSEDRETTGMGRYRDDRDGAGGGPGLEVDFVLVRHMCIVQRRVNVNVRCRSL